ncbi:Ger(x)C family spore germination protein [Bacillus sp. es.036]|uniref:Ger(x)C family spore germination protein n=1 Tax=Bacillus sp. es.036 TaxID=1761764 RepID=UPI000BF4B361|nr:Ger(x)C family spore germination protein [Bacillus sp. es.036]PFG03228.1 spore germination protein [Bacillus sp. es.036]
MTRLFIFIVSILLLTGCVQRSILDDIQMVTIIGYDLPEEDSEEGLIKGVAVAPQYQADGRIDNSVFIQTAALSKEIRSQYNSESPKPFVSGKLEVALFSKDIAETEGIIQLVDTLQRDPSIGSRVFLGISSSDMETLLRTNYGNVDTGTFIHDTLNHNSKHGMLPETNLHDFLYNYYSEGNDPFLPLVELDEDKVKIIGLALFQGDRMVGSIDAKHLFTFKVLHHKFSSNDSFTVKINEEEHAAIYNIASKRNLNLKKVGSNKIEIYGEVLGVIKEYSGQKLTPAKLKEIEVAMEDDIEKRGMEMIEEFQTQNIDPLGLGNAVRSVTRGDFTKEDWRQQYPDMDITFQMNVTVTESGVIE